MINGTYYNIIPDGAPMKCIDCDVIDDLPKIKIIGLFGAHHIDCVDPEWVATARDLSKGE